MAACSVRCAVLYTASLPLFNHCIAGEQQSIPGTGLEGGVGGGGALHCHCSNMSERGAILGVRAAVPGDCHTCLCHQSGIVTHRDDKLIVIAKHGGIPRRPGAALAHSGCYAVSMVTDCLLVPG